MPHDASGDVRLPHVNDLHPDVATFMIARAFAETYRDVFDAPLWGLLQVPYVQSRLS